METKTVSETYTDALLELLFRSEVISVGGYRRMEAPARQIVWGPPLMKQAILWTQLRLVM
jgi:hypothetical protein